MLTIRLDSDVPLTDQIRRGIRQAIAAGEVKPGDPLPTVRQLATDLGINLNTVARAYRQLEADGLVTPVRGRGTVVKAAREVTGEAEETVQKRFVGEIRNLLANARLAGLSRQQTQDLVSHEAETFWSKG
jgi:GntR family transcriptional regulator